MTFVRKILVIVQVVFSVCFMIFATAVYTTRENWKEQYVQSKTELENVRRTAQQNEADLQLQIDKLSADLTVAQTDVGQAQAAVQGLQQQLNTTAAELELVRTERDSQRLLAEISGEAEAFRRDEAIKQRSVNAILHDAHDALTAEVRQQSDEIFTRKMREERILARYEDLLRKNAALRSLVRSLGIDPDAELQGSEQEPPPTVAGRVLNSRKSRRNNIEYIEISVGSNDGLNSGHQLYVYRDDKYLGQIELIHVTPDRAVGTIVQRAKNGIIQRGDNVSTKL